MYLFLQKFSKNSEKESNSFHMSEIFCVTIDVDAFENIVKPSSLRF